MAQLIVIDGPNIGMMFPLSKKTTIGSDDGNTIRLTDKEVAAQQAVITSKGDEWLVTNKDKKIEMRVNSVTTKEIKLSDGDCVEWGMTKVFFNAEKERAAVEAAKGAAGPRKAGGAGGQPTPGENLGGNTVQTRQKFFDNADDVLASLCGVGGGGGADNKATERLQVLFRVTHAISSIMELQPLLEALFTIIFQECQADRGAILWVEGDAEKDPEGCSFTTAIELIRGAEGQPPQKPPEPIKYSRTVVKEAVKTKESILTADAQADARFGAAMSIMDQKICSVMCVPLVVKKKVIGLILLDTTKQYKAFSKGDLELMTGVAMQGAVAIDNVRMQAAMKDKDRLEHEMGIAASIQIDLLPKKIPASKHLDMAGYMVPAKEVGGDYYDFLYTKDSPDILVAIGDVSGKGLPAGLVMVMARCFLKILAKTDMSTREMVLALNENLQQDTKSNMFMTMNVLRFKESESKLYYTSGGHEHIIIWRNGQKEEDGRQKVECIKAGGTALGLLKNQLAGRLYVEKTIDLNVGDTVLLYTDGVSEAVNEKGDFYELENVVELGRKHGHHATADEVFNAILDELKVYMGDAEQHDDITMAILKRREDENPKEKVGQGSTSAKTAPPPPEEKPKAEKKPEAVPAAAPAAAPAETKEAPAPAAAQA
ncbi:MAG: SpoIIE family protein phosphatase [Planctomycetes bacterium]|nr:SpoIIE family protein phosphatase [Planctomycetota bacterium]